MFKLQNATKSMNFNNNTEKYSFSNKKNKTKIRNFSNEIENSKGNIRNSLACSTMKNSSFPFNESTAFRLNCVPPIYFYRRANKPYKYNITKVPEYLIKSDQQKKFLDHLYETFHGDSKTINLLNKLRKEYDRNPKDRFYPKNYEVQEFLHFKPEIYNKSLENEIKNQYNKNKFHEKYIKTECQNDCGKRENNTLKNKGNKEEILIEDEKKEERIEKESVEATNNSKPRKPKPKLYIKTDNDLMSKTHHIADSMTQKDKIKYKYQLSDVFNQSTDKIFTDKSSERYLFKKFTPKRNGFYSTSTSGSDWVTKLPKIPKQNTYSSVGYNILSPLYKGQFEFKNATILNAKNKYNEAKDYHKLKSISEFIHLTRVSADNSLNNYNPDLNKEAPDFKYVNNVCNDHLNAYNPMRNILSTPF